MSNNPASHYANNDALLDDLRGFADRLFDTANTGNDSIEPAWSKIVTRMTATIDEQQFLPWIQTAITFRLGASDQHLLLLALLAELDDSYQRRLLELATLNAESAQSDVPPATSKSSAGVPLQTVQRLLGDIGANLLPDAPLPRSCLIETTDANMATMTGTYRLASPLVAYLAAVAAPQLRLDDMLLPELREDGSLEDHLIDEQAKRQLKRFIEVSQEHRSPSLTFLLHLQSIDSGLLTSLCAATFAELGYGTARLDAKRLRQAYERSNGRRLALLSNLRTLCRDAILCNTVIVLTDCQWLTDDAERESRDDLFDDVLHVLFEMQRYVAVLNGPARSLAESAHRYPAHEVVPFNLPIDAPDADLRRRAWTKHAARCALELDRPLLDRVVDGFRFPEERVAMILKDVAAKQLLLDAPNIPDLVIAACRAEAEAEPIGVAKELRLPYRLSDIVAPEQTLDLLNEMLTRVRYRQRVLDEWGFAGKYAASGNLRVLLHGPSGTGKSMAASVVANELGLSLYRVDLSSVLSKYVGETEQNLALLFDRAETRNLVLFFDEAESLFAKRMDNRDAHDRYANHQVAYLLQRIESYQGIVLLATNLLGNMDKAFLRRFPFVIEFPLPAVEQRKALLHQAFPPATPIDGDVDFDLIAQKAVLSGGNIVNVAINSAFRAAAEDVPVSMRHVVQSIEREYMKLGKVFVRSDFERS